MIGLGAGAGVGAAAGGSVGANSWYNDRALEFTNNPTSKEVVLGRTGLYDEIAIKRGATYFHTSDERWDEVCGMTGVKGNGMWRINKAFLNQQIALGKTFILTNDPVSDSGQFFGREVSYLSRRGIGYVFYKE